MKSIIDNLPIYLQIAYGVKEAILDQSLKEEEPLPSTVKLSKEYNINVATVNKAFNTFVDEGLVYKKRGLGMLVKKGARALLIKERRKRFAEQYVKRVLKEVKNLDYTVEELQQIVKETYEAMEK